MTALVTTRAHQLADALAELKVKVRAALATELAGARFASSLDVSELSGKQRVKRPTSSGSWRWGTGESADRDAEGSQKRASSSGDPSKPNCDRTLRFGPPKIHYSGHDSNSFTAHAAT